MSTAAQNGVNFILQVSPDGGTTWQTVAGATGAMLKRKANMVNITNKDSLGDQENMQGERSWQIDFTQLWVASDAGQVTLTNNFYSGASFKVRIQYNGSGNTYTGSALISTLDEDMKNEAAVTFNGTLIGTGPLTSAGTAH